jgi:uncharacterized protein DUF4399
MRRATALALPLFMSGLYLISGPVESCDPNARVFFIRPYNGATVTSPVQVIFGAELVDVRPAPEGEPGGNVGHHDLLINLASVPVGTLIPSDEDHLRFDKGEGRAELKLPPGEHTLTLQFADGADRSHGVEMSATIHVNVVQ